MNEALNKPQRAILFLAGLLALIAIPLYAYKITQIHEYTDFDVYYRAALRFKKGLFFEIYNLADGASPFRYAPLTLPLLRPFAEVSLETAKLIWYFAQVGFFSLGFWFLYRSLRVIRAVRSQAFFITCFSFLFIFRLCLDTFTIGQISSFMFFGFALSLYGYLYRKPFLAGCGLFIPSIFKIGPAYLYALFSVGRKRERVQAVLAPLACLSALVALFAVTLRAPQTARELWLSWSGIVAADSSYYDASHYGSQSIKSAILRMVKNGTLTPEQGFHTFLAGAILLCVLVFAFWLLRKPKSTYGRGLFYSSGLFIYLWCMPETFKYSLTPLAIPVAFLLASPRRSFFTNFVLFFGACTISLPGLDLVGRTAFFAIQRWSLPLLATLLLGFETLRQAYLDSIPAFSGWRGKQLGAWRKTPSSPTMDASFLIPVALQSTTEIDEAFTQNYLATLLQLASKEFASFEILVMPYGNRASRYHPIWQLLEDAAQKDSCIHFLPPAPQEGYGATLRELFLESRGKLIFSSPIDQPCDFEFFRQARVQLSAGFDLIRGNRRHPDTRFVTSVEHLAVVYGRHRLGLWFNRIVRFFVPVGTNDTQSGIFGMNREVALESFLLMSSRDFLALIELSLVAAAHPFKALDLPVKLILSREKTLARMGREALSIVKGLPLLALRSRARAYHSFNWREIEAEVTADDFGFSPGVNAGTIELAKLGVIKRVSVMSEARYAQEGVAELRKIPSVQIGLHFDLTFGKISPARLFISWMNPFTDHAKLKAQIRLALENQLKRLQTFGVKPSHLDGHHHIHLLPGLLTNCADILKQFDISVVRIPLDYSLVLTARFPLVALSWLARREVRGLGLQTLPCYYPPLESFEDPGALRASLKAHAGSEIIVHPSSVDDSHLFEFSDPYTQERITEYRALLTLEFRAGVEP